MPNGKVRWFSNRHNFGFIANEAGQDVFVHFSDIEMEGFKSLKEGQEVTYELEDTEKGLRARKVFPGKLNDLKQ
jgi:cold shock protein